MEEKSSREEKVRAMLLAMKSKKFSPLPLTEKLIDYSHCVGKAGVDPKLLEAEKRCQQHEWSIMMGGKEVVKLLQVLCGLINARVAIEIGTFLGYTSLALSQVLPEDGTVFTLERNENYCKEAEDIWLTCNAKKNISLLKGDAIESLEKLRKTHSNNVDIIFIDGDKSQYSRYFEEACHLIRRGGVIVLDNTLLLGEVVNEESFWNESVAGIRKVNELVQNLPDDSWRIVNLSVADGVTIVTRLK